MYIGGGGLGSFNKKVAMGVPISPTPTQAVAAHESVRKATSNSKLPGIPSSGIGSLAPPSSGKTLLGS